MSREILFRGKTTKKDGNKAFNNIWVEGDLVHAGISGLYIHPQANTFVVDNELTKFIVMHEVIPETVGQFTGLTDKNGKKIFEGDIVKGLFKYNCPVNSVVHFQDGTFGLKWYRGNVEMFWGFTNICNVTYEVIGNIHDNPELLQEK